VRTGRRFGKICPLSRGRGEDTAETRILLSTGDGGGGGRSGECERRGGDGWICYGGGGGGGSAGYGKTSHYEIITKPAVYDHDHLVHGATYSSAPYGYARHLTMDEGGPPGGVFVGAYHGGRGVHSPQLPPRHVSVVHAAAHTGGGGGGGGGGLPSDDDPSTGPGGLQTSPAADDGDEEASNGHASYPLSPIAYMPTNNA